MVPTRTIAIAAVVLLSIAVAGTVVAQSDASIERDVPSGADFNETITIEVTIIGDSLTESYNRDVDPTIVDADGGEAAESADELEVTWTESGEYTVTYEITTPESRPLEVEGIVSNGSGASATSSTHITLEAWYEDYTNDEGVVDKIGLNDVVKDYFAGNLDAGTMNIYIESYLLRVPVEEVGEN